MLHRLKLNVSLHGIKLNYITIIIIMKEGKVKFFNETKGFGFIKDAETNEEYFVHATGLIDQVNEDDNVSFELQEGKRGLIAVNVKVVY